jgi:penicillin-binding protein A
MLKALNIPLTLGFFLLCFWTIALLFYYSRAASPAKPATGTGVRWLLRCVCMMFLAVYLYQASWQLAGFSRPAFMDFMRKYSRRPVNPAKEMARGRILDRNGQELAVNDRSDKLLRRYPYGRSFSHLIGYIDPMFGLSGLEAADNSFLNGSSLSSPDELGRFSMNILNHRAAEGNDLQLTIDARLQKTAAALLRDRPGAIVALQPQDGSVLALVSAPSFTPEELDASLFSEERKNSSPLLNRAVQGMYPPGSIIKIMVTACALENGFANLLDCPGGGYTPPGPYHRPIRDHEYYEYQRRGETWPGWGRIGMEAGFARSSNVFFSQLGVKLGSRQLNKEAERFLFNKPLVLFEGSSGTISVKQSFWPAVSPEDPGSLAQQSIGQGAMLVTPLHMALVAAAIARDGQLYAPRLAVRTPTRLLDRIMDYGIAEKLKQFMRYTVEHGTARGANIKGLNIAGKTGTAQASEGADHSWFVCFAPLEQPAIALAVIIEHGGYGAASALPVATELVKKAKKLGLLEPEPAPPAEVTKKTAGKKSKSR